MLLLELKLIIRLVNPYLLDLYDLLRVELIHILDVGVQLQFKVEFILVIVLDVELSCHVINILHVGVQLQYLLELIQVLVLDVILELLEDFLELYFLLFVLDNRDLYIL